MSYTNFIQSVIRFVKKHTFTNQSTPTSQPTPFPKQPEKTFSEERKAAPEVQNPIKNSLFEASSIMTVSSPKGCSNQELIDRYNELSVTMLPPRLLVMYLNDLEHEFVSRFYKSPFRKDDHSRIVGWKEKLQYLEESQDYIFINKKTSEEAALPEPHVSKNEEAKYKEELKKYANSELIDQYNRIHKIQRTLQKSLYVIAMNMEFTERFGKTPFRIKNNQLVEFGYKIVYLESLDTFIEINEN